MLDRSLLTVSQFVTKHPAFRESGIRDWIWRGKKNGLTKAIRRVGRKVLLDEKLFFDWVDEQQHKAA